MLMRHLDALTPILSWALSALIPNTYLGLGALTASLLIQAAHRCRPSVRLGRLNTAITETLTRAKSTCAWAHLALVENERCLLQAELGASKVQTRLLKLAVRDSGSEPERSRTWMAYLQEMHKISQALTESEIQIREAETSILLTIEAERQRKLGKDINETREIADIMVQPAGGTTRNF